MPKILVIAAFVQKWRAKFGICVGRAFIARHAGTEADFCFIAEVNYKCSIAKRQPITKAK